MTASTIFRDFATDGVPSSGAHNPIKSDIRTWGGGLETKLSNIPARNVLINGSFDIWQRGTSFASDGYTADRWRAVNITAVSQQTGPTQAQTGSTGCAAYAIRFGNSSATYPQIQQRMERSRVRHLAGRTVTLSFWARQVSGTAALNVEYLVPSAADNFTSVTATSIGTAWASGAGSSTWAKYSFTFTCPAGAETTGLGINIFCGNTAATTVEVAMVQLELGSVATSFEFHHIADTLLRCQRYFRLSGSMNSVIMSSSTDGDIIIPLAPQMRATPTVALVSGAHQFVFPNLAAPSITPTLGGSQRSATAIMQSISGFTGRSGQNHGYCYTDLFQLSAEL